VRLAQCTLVRFHHAEPARLDFVPEKFHGLAKTPTLGQAKCHCCATQQAQDAVDMADKLLLRLGIHYDIFEDDEAALPLQPGENDVKRPLECRGCVRPAERHPFELEGDHVAHESRLFPIHERDGNLPAAGTSIECREDGRLAEAIDALVHAGQGYESFFVTTFNSL